VAVTATGGDGLQHVLVWNPVTGSVRDLGPGVARGISVDGVVVGRTLDGQAAFWSADGVAHPLGFAGTLLRINLFGRVVGLRTQSGGPRPIVLDLARPGVVTALRLPRGWPFGSAKGISDSGVIVGTAYKNAAGGLPSEGILWTSPSRPVTVQKLLGRNAPRGGVFSDAGGVDDNGLIAGAVAPHATFRASAAQAGAVEIPAVGRPDPADKLQNLGNEVGRVANLLIAGGNGAGNQAAYELHLVLRAAKEDVFLSEHAPNPKDRATGHRKACTALEEAQRMFRSFHYELVFGGFDANQLAQFKKDGKTSLDEVKSEIGC